MSSSYASNPVPQSKPSFSTIAVTEQQPKHQNEIQSKVDAMDKVLKAHQMNSASARRKRIQERQEEQDIAARQYQEHKRRMVIYDDGTEDTSDEEQSEDEKIELFRRNREWSLDTPSEHSILTPDDTNPILPLFSKQNLIGTPRASPIVHSDLVHDHEEDPHEKLPEVPQPLIKKSPGPTLQASLIALSDFTYDRFSTIMDSPPGLVSSPEFDDSDSSSSIETATPVSYRQPNSRPSVISITNIRKRSKRKNVISTQSPLSQQEVIPVPPPRSRKRVSQSNLYPPFLASEATPFEVPDLPINARNIIANASKESLGTFPSERTESIKQRKSSIPFLTGTLKSSQDKMNSIKNFVKSPSQTQGQSFFRPSSSHHRSLTSSSKSVRDIPSVETLPQITNPKIANLANMQRPQTARTSSMHSAEINVTALPAPPSPLTDEMVDGMDESRDPVQRKKSFSMLRRRSGSIGQAIKSVASKTSKSSPTTTSRPDMPTPSNSFLTSPDSAQSIDLSKFPSPPIPSPRSRKSIMSLSYLPTGRNSNGGPIGLGLRS